MRARALGLSLATLVSGLAVIPTAAQPAGVAPTGVSTCPPDHPIKVYTSLHSAGPGIYYPPGSGFYDQVKPERCFASEEAARRAGFAASREERPPAADDGRTRRRKP